MDVRNVRPSRGALPTVRDESHPFRSRSTASCALNACRRSGRRWSCVGDGATGPVLRFDPEAVGEYYLKGDTSADMGSPLSLLAFVDTRGYVHPADGSRTEASHEIYAYRIDAATGELTRLAVSDGGENPLYLAVHPNRAYLYAVNQASEGTITALRIDRGTGELTRTIRRTTGDSNRSATNRSGGRGRATSHSTRRVGFCSSRITNRARSFSFGWTTPRAN